MSFNTHLIPKGLPANLSGIQPNPDHLLSTTSVAALSRADGWQEGAQHIDATLMDFETVMAANDNRPRIEEKTETPERKAA